jgi:RimJ/RimL family protein N-acetyltransferase
MKAPTHLETARLILRPPTLDDAEAIFERYASDPEVTTFLGWPRHQTIQDTKAFLQFSTDEWARWPAGAHRPSQRVLEKCGFVLGDPPTRLTEFPNLAPGSQQDALSYARLAATCV